MKILIPTEENIKLAAEYIAQGKIVIVPSSTLYSVVTNATMKDSVERIYEIKGRDKCKALGIIINKEDISKYAEADPISQHIIDTILPAPLQLVLPKKDTVDDFLTAGMPSVMLVCHDNEILQQIYDQIKIPIAGTSANLSGCASPTSLKDVADFVLYADLALDAGTTKYNLSGTIIDMSGENPKVLREGAYPLAKLRELVPTLPV